MRPIPGNRIRITFTGSIVCPIEFAFINYFPDIYFNNYYFLKPPQFQHSCIREPAMKKHHAVFSFLCFSLLLIAPLMGSAQRDDSPVLGRWDVTVLDPNGRYPSWFEIIDKNGTLSGRFTGRFGHARAIDAVTFDGRQLTLSIPVQYEKQKTNLIFKGIVSNGVIEGKTNAEAFNEIPFRAERAPSLVREGEIEWGEPVNLIDESLSAWKPRHEKGKIGWKTAEGVMTNTPPSVDFVTKAGFSDFKLHIEFKIPEKGNSGIYLRGRYEVQLSDSYGQEPHDRKCGGVYGFLTPSETAVNPANEWNSADVTLIGRRITLVMNGKKIIDNGEIPGITGGALDSREGEPGPLMLQGDHGQAEFRNVVIIPAR